MRYYQGNDFQVIFDKDSQEAKEAIEYLSQSHKRLKVEYEERKAFLAPFLPLLLNKKKGHGLAGVSKLAEVLHLTVNFMDADGGSNTLNVECIKAEIYKIYHEMYPED